MQQTKFVTVGRKGVEKIFKVHLVSTISILFNVIQVTGNNIKNSDLIYILLWYPTEHEPFKFVEREQNAFVNRKCAFRNCFITENRNYFHDILEFDVIMFDSLTLYENMEIPSERSPYQKYVFSAWEPAAYYFIHERFNEFFNLTWTYKLDSDIPLPYVIIKDQFNEVIGPKINMHWIDLLQMNATSTYIKNKLRKKHIAAACFVSNCVSSDRIDFIYELKKELLKYGHRLDVYGVCGNFTCGKAIAVGNDMDECLARIESDYYFYLAFENSFSADYVSEKLLHALEHFAVPVVLGGADYSRFMPKGIYLDANKLGPERLAKKMSRIINDTEQYYEFFRWHGYYSFHSAHEDRYQREVCALCELFNNETRMNSISIWHRIVDWWNVPFPATRSAWHLVLDEEEVGDGEKGFVNKLYNYLFEY